MKMPETPPEHAPAPAETTSEPIPELSEAEKRCQELQARNEDLTNTLKRLQAEFENYKKRSLKEQQMFAQASKCKFVQNLLPVIDSFDQAVASTKDAGIIALHKMFQDALAALGIHAFESMNKPFDHSRHEVMLMQESEGKENMVLAEIQKGYMCDDTILRYAKVIVSKKKETPSDNTDQNGA